MLRWSGGGRTVRRHGSAFPTRRRYPVYFSYLGVSDVKELKKRLDDDIYPVAGDSKL